MPRDYTDPQYLRFISENVEKEREQRMRWFTKNHDEILKSAQFPENYAEIRTADVTKSYLRICIPSFSDNYKNSMIYHRKRPIRDGPVLGLGPASKLKRRATLDTVKSSVPESVMFPVEPDVEDIHYQGLPSGGRRQYLKARNRKSPEDKYYDEETSNNRYGWKLKYSKLLVGQASPFRRYSTFTYDLQSRSGPQPDPPYYEEPPRDPYSRCP